MELTSIKVNKVDLGKIVAFADVVIDEELCIKGIKVIKGPNGLFVGMPSRKDKNDKYQDIVYPINKNARAKIESAIIKEYEGDIFGE